MLIGPQENVSLSIAEVCTISGHFIDQFLSVVLLFTDESKSDNLWHELWTNLSSPVFMIKRRHKWNNEIQPIIFLSVFRYEQLLMDINPIPSYGLRLVENIMHFHPQIIRWETRILSVYSLSTHCEKTELTAAQCVLKNFLVVLGLQQVRPWVWPTIGAL